MTKEKKKKEIKEKGITESFLGGIPIMGGFFKELAKTEVFKKRFKEVDEKIEENLRKGEKRKWGFEANISVRPILNEVKKDTTKMAVGEDYFYGEKEGALTMAIKVPNKDVDVNIKGKTLLITSKNFKKKIELPYYYKYFEKKSYKNNILVLELSK